jgi:hypothetical protein
MLQQLRTEDQYLAKVEDAISIELARAQAGELASVSTKAAARYIGKHHDTLGDWRRASPRIGPPFEKGIDGRGLGNEHISYPYPELVEWNANRASKTSKERRLMDELEQVRQRARELELELQLQEAKEHAAKLAKKLGRKMGFNTLSDCVAIEDWAMRDGMLVGHVLGVSDEELVEALAGNGIVSTSLEQALRLAWNNPEQRLPYEDAFETALENAKDQSRQGLEAGLQSRSVLITAHLQDVIEPASISSETPTADKDEGRL